ncbi:unnamed protein product, partial [Ectocarpus sp. 12 AP-2014]
DRDLLICWSPRSSGGSFVCVSFVWQGSADIDCPCVISREERGPGLSLSCAASRSHPPVRVGCCSSCCVPHVPRGSVRCLPVLLVLHPSPPGPLLQYL